MTEESYIKFDRDHVGKIIDGLKTQTIRRGEPYLNEGEEIELQTPRGVNFTEAVVSEISQVKAGEIPDIDFEGHQNYDEFGSFAVEMFEYYGEQVYRDDDFHVINFVVIE